MESDSSAKAGSNAFRGKSPSPPLAPRAESRKEERDEGRNGVVGREVCVREAGRCSGELGASADIVVVIDTPVLCMIGAWSGPRVLSVDIRVSKGRSCD